MRELLSCGVWDEWNPEWCAVRAACDVCCTSAGLLELTLESLILLLKDSNLIRQLTDRVESLDVDVCRST